MPVTAIWICPTPTTLHGYSFIPQCWYPAKSKYSRARTCTWLLRCVFALAGPGSELPGAGLSGSGSTTSAERSSKDLRTVLVFIVAIWLLRRSRFVPGLRWLARNSWARFGRSRAVVWLLSCLFVSPAAWSRSLMAGIFWFQYLSGTNFLPFSEAWSSYAPFMDRSGSLTFRRGNFW